MCYSSYKVSRLHYLLIFVFLATSCFPSFINFSKLIPLLLPVLWYKIERSKIKISNKFWLGLAVVCIFAMLHFILGNFSTIGFLNFVLTMAVYLLSAIYMGKSIGVAFIRIMRFICYISLIIWILIIFIPLVKPFLMFVGTFLPQMLSEEWMENTSNAGVSLYIYFLPTNPYASVSGILRNCGPFFEPGLFASYISIALIISMIYNQNLFHRANVVLFLSLISTCSSAGYITMFLIILYSVYSSKKMSIKISIIFAMLVLWQPVMELDFMSNKIQNNYTSSSESSSSRFGALIYHSEKIILSPLIGYVGGALPLTQFDRFLGNTNSDRQLSPNGLSFPFVYWGIPLAILFFVNLFKGLKLLLPSKIPLFDVRFVYLIVLSASFSQTITTEPILLIISMLPFLNKNNDEKLKNSSCAYL